MTDPSGRGERPRADESIRTAASIQPHGFLLALDARTRTVTQASASVERWLGHTPATLLGRPVDPLLADPPDALDGFASEYADPHPLGRVAMRRAQGDVVLFDCAVHHQGGLAIAEFERSDASAAGPAGPVPPMAGAFVDRLHDTDGIPALCERAAAEIKRLTGHGRVRVLRFDADGQGQVIAEQADDGYARHLGTRFAAGDVPAPSALTRFRVIPDVDDTPSPLVPPLDARTGQPLDLRRALLRGVPPGLLQALRDLGMRASMSMPIVVDGRLWGGISCHDRSPRLISPSTRAACEWLGGLLSLRIEARLAHDAADRAEALNRVNDEFERFSISVSHELRAPLRHISSYADLLADTEAGTMTERGRHFVANIRQSARFAGRLVEDLLAFSRTGRVEIAPVWVDVQDLVATVQRELLADYADRRVEWRIAMLPSMWADPAALHLALRNLIDNALKYTRHRPSARIEIGAYREGDDDVLVVRDNGAGFDMRAADRLFGLFQRLHRPEEFEGTGIGLAHVRRLVERHGGRTWAEGQVDVGATFYVALPRRSPQPVQGADAC